MLRANVTNDQQRVVGRAGAFAIVAGSMLGIGIFITPPLVARHLPDVGWFLGIWLAGGITALGGAVAFTELAAMFPRAGGDFVFHQQTYGASVAFAAGLTLFVATFAGSVAAMSVPLCTYQIPYLVGLATGNAADWSQPLIGSISTARVAAVALIVGIVALNTTRIRVSVNVQLVVTLVPIAALALAALWLALTGTATAEAPAQAPEITIAAITAAWLPVYFAYSGWNAVVYIAGDVKDPGVTLPVGLVGGTLAVTALYMLMCWGYLAALSLPGLAGVFEAGSATAETVSPTAVPLVAGLILMALLGSINATVLAGGRVGMAMAEGGAFPRPFAARSATGAPVRALWALAVLACAFVLTGTFEQIIDLASMAMLLTGSLSVLAVFLLRRERPNVDRPYRATGYPWLPGLYLLASGAVLIVQTKEALSSDEDGALFPLIGLGVMVVAFAAHRLLAPRAPKGTSP